MNLNPDVEDEKKVFSNDTVEIILYKNETDNHHGVKISANGWSTEIYDLNLKYDSTEKYKKKIEDSSEEIMEFCTSMGVKRPNYQIQNKNGIKSETFNTETNEKRFITFLKNELDNPIKYNEIKNQFKQTLYNLVK